MGITYIDGTVRGPNEREEPVTFLVDSGVTYSLLPKYVWENIGLVPKREETFSLAYETTTRKILTRRPPSTETPLARATWRSTTLPAWPFLHFLVCAYFLRRPPPGLLCIFVSMTLTPLTPNSVPKESNSPMSLVSFI